MYISVNNTMNAFNILYGDQEGGGTYHIWKNVCESTDCNTSWGPIGGDSEKSVCVFPDGKT